MPPYLLTYVGATPSSVTIRWEPNEDDGGSPIRFYRVKGYSINATCSADERSPLHNVTCVYRFDYPNCSTSLDSGLVEIPGTTCEAGP